MTRFGSEEVMAPGYRAGAETLGVRMCPLQFGSAMIPIMFHFVDEDIEAYLN